ncbi:MAG: TaqI-like C-terminal specificity domain-containing protein, partial [Ktedonobacteraceae bacterium]
MLLTKGRIEQIVDLPQGIWPDVNVDCVLLFLIAETNEEKRKAQQVQINVLGLRDTIEKLTERTWAETLLQTQSRWLANAKYEINIRYDALLQQIEQICTIPVNSGSTTKIQRLGDVTESTQGIIPYHTRAEGKTNPYIKPRREVPPNEPDWKPLLDGSAFIGRYELRWGRQQPYLKYGSWLYSVPRSQFFESPKLLIQDMRNRALKRRLVATFDDQRFYNRHNFDDIIARDPDYDLKYILALVNSAVLNYWFARQFDNVHINPSYFRQLPIYPADPDTQATFAAPVDEMLAKHAELNRLRSQDYSIRQQRTGTIKIAVPYDRLLGDLQTANAYFPVLTFFDAMATQLFNIPDKCDLQAPVSSNVYIPERYPTSVVLRHNRLWLEVPDDDLRRYMLGYLRSPRWAGKTWDDLKNEALLPEGGDALTAFFRAEAQQINSIRALLEEIQRIDAQIDERVLDLYGITNPTDRQRILGSAPAIEEEEGEETPEDETV